MNLYPIIFMVSVGCILSSHLTLAKQNWVSQALCDRIATVTTTNKATIESSLSFWQQKEKRHVPTWRTQHNTIVDLINRHNFRIGVEVGVTFAACTEKILQKTKIKKLYSCDPYRVYDNWSVARTQLDWDVLYLVAQHRLSHFGNRSILLRLPSVGAMEHVNDNELDFVYIDGDHSYEAVQNDLNGWYGKVRPGGFIMGDDYKGPFLGVKKAVDEFAQQHKLHLSFPDGRTFVMVKPQA